MNLRYELWAAQDAGETRRPALVIEEMGIKFKEWQSHPICEQIWLMDVDEATLPKPLPPYMSRFTDQYGRTDNLSEPMQ